ncbi:Ribokinase-like protein [Dichomitus squalens LYAD-421 SS1]|uniref:pyridoxal kinase n=1 Tax=Dichomitus squalens (strain LYAD-421) TaxID=732165 RepID=R7SPS1_DICSQ|nr:Ribokinase-like protein [Dichomitus squalens LYAD-421 SS1]EJF58096.1 Ribokinase-like protein [Dichomitus squalens LYAD-421 SS1]
MATGNISHGRILSIQSHVAYGYVGGKAAVFPLQCLGYDVDVINTVNFSNHSGYGRFGGSRASAQELSQIFDIMDQNGLLYPERLLTGYVPGAEATEAVTALAQRLRHRSPKLIYLLDPVLGDSGRLYVSPDVVPIYKNALHLATIITPNWFEVEVLTDTKITDAVSLRQATQVLHQTYHVPHVVISSIPLKSWLLDLLPAHLHPASASASTSEYLACIASSRQGSSSTVYATCFPCLPGYFSGVGDLFSALVLAHFTDEPTTEGETSLSRAVSQAVSKTHAMLVLTHEAAAALPEDERTVTDEELDVREPIRKIRRMRGRELRLIQGQDIIRGTQPIEFRRLQAWDTFWDA